MNISHPYYAVQRNNSNNYIKMNYIVVPLEKLDTNKVTFGKAKENQYKGTNIPLYYKREDKDVPLYVKVKGCVCPFGIKQNTEMYGNKVSGYSLSISLKGNYAKKKWKSLISF